MKKHLFKLAISITAIASGISIGISLLPNPTDIQKDLAATTNAIAVGGATAMFGLLDDDEPKDE